jgi:hypothetical protein
MASMLVNMLEKFEVDSDYKLNEAGAPIVPYDKFFVAVVADRAEV